MLRSYARCCDNLVDSPRFRPSPCPRKTQCIVPTCLERRAHIRKTCTGIHPFRFPTFCLCEWAAIRGRSSRVLEQGDRWRRVRTRGRIGSWRCCRQLRLSRRLTEGSCCGECVPEV